MNVANLDSVAAYCEAFAQRVDGDPAAQSWYRRNLRNYVLRTPSLHVAAAREADYDACVAAGLLDDPPEWLEAARARGDDIVAFDPTLPDCVALSENCGRAVDWFLARDRGVPPESIAKAAVPDVLAASAAWHANQTIRRLKALAKRLRLPVRTVTAMVAAQDPSVAALWPDDPSGATVVYAPGGAHEVVSLTSRDALEREGTLLDHCVGDYGPSVASKKCRIYSIRDRNNMPLATLEVVPFGRQGGDFSFLARYLPPEFHVLQQARGRSNVPVAAELRPFLKEFLASLGIGVTGHSPAAFGHYDAEAGTERYVDISALVDDFDAIASLDCTAPRMKPGRFAVSALRLACGALERLDDGRRHALLAHFLPRPEDLASVHEIHDLGFAKLSRSTTTVPTGLFSPAIAPVRNACPDMSYEACRPTARAAIARLAADPASVHDVKFSLPGAFPSPDAFFAFAGLYPEWVAARDTASEGGRRHLGETAARIRRELAKDALDTGTRARLLNALNVAIPSLLKGAAPSPSTKARPGVAAKASETGTLRRLMAAGGKAV